MNTVQTNVRVLPGDKPLIRSIAARLRVEPRFRERLASLLEEDSTPALQERVERLEEQVRRLLAAADPPRPAHLVTQLPVRVRSEPTSGGHSG